MGGNTLHYSQLGTLREGIQSFNDALHEDQHVAVTFPVPVCDVFPCLQHLARLVEATINGIPPFLPDYAHIDVPSQNYTRQPMPVA
jgi:hypothetical protein